MANEYTPDLITLIGDDGKEIDFEILDIIENDEGKFYVLYPFFENPEDAVNDSGEYYIFEVTEIDGEEELAEIEDDDKLDRIAAVFEERYNEEFYDEDDLLFIFLHIIIISGLKINYFEFLPDTLMILK